MRLIDKNTIRYVRDTRDRTCIYGFYHHAQKECNGGLEVHHIVKRSQLGDDVPENLITLCHKHHDDAERHNIESVVLKEYVDRIEGLRKKHKK